jgi:hypothetical protein
MSCCGKNRAQIAPMPQAKPERPPSLPSRGPATNRATITLEYRGKGLLAVTGPVTNRTYVFTRTGQRVIMGARDRDLARTFVSLRLVPNR